MKTLAVLAFICMCAIACNQGTSPLNGPLPVSFTMTDTAGQTISQVHPGEDFLLSFKLTNTTPDTLNYVWANSGPSVVFRIQNNDSVLASSVDGYIFLMDAPHRYLSPGQSLQTEWKAPTTPAQNPKVMLTSGSYEATVYFPSFYEIKIDPVSPITFRVAQ